MVYTWNVKERKEVEKMVEDDCTLYCSPRS